MGLVGSGMRKRHILMNRITFVVGGEPPAWCGNHGAVQQQRGYRFDIESGAAASAERPSGSNLGRQESRRVLPSDPRGAVAGALALLPETFEELSEGTCKRGKRVVPQPRCKTVCKRNAPRGWQCGPSVRCGVCAQGKSLSFDARPVRLNE